MDTGAWFLDRKIATLLALPSFYDLKKRSSPKEDVMRNIFLAGLGVLAVTSCLTYTEKAHAIIEVRASYGVDTTSPADLNNNATANGVPTVGALTGFGIDAIVSPPLFPLGFGLRYESIGQTATVGANSAGVNYTRVSALIDYRVIDTLIFLGAIGSLGLTHTNSVNFNVNGNSQNYTGGSTSSYSVGIEGGAKLLGFMAGAEVGYQSYVNTGLTNANGSALNGKLDLSGSYAKVLIGFGF
jgi:hypothetical protein